MTILLHLKRLWPEFIGTVRWPYALKKAADQLNCMKIGPIGNAIEGVLHQYYKHNTP